jgi:hypothetical protein
MFLFEIWYTFMFLLFVKNPITTQISVKFRRLYACFLSEILTCSLFWEPIDKKKDYWKFPGLICKQILVVYKNAFWRAEKAFFSTAPIYLLWYIRNILDWLEVSKCVFIWNVIYIRVPTICFKCYLHPHFY